MDQLKDLDKIRITLNFEGKDSLSNIALNKGLARLGDSFLNFIYSLALSESKGVPTGGHVTDQVLFEVAKSTGVKSLLPKRIPKDQLADAIEALIVFTWLQGSINTDELITFFRKKSYDPKLSLQEIVLQSIKRLT